MRWRRRSDDDFAREVRSHLDLEAARLVDEGMSPSAARDAARRAFGNVLGAQERFHEAHRWVWVEQVLLDTRYAWRGLRQSPAFLATAVLTLAVGLGLVTSLFAIFNAYVLRPFAVRDPQALHQISGARRTPAAVNSGGASTRRCARGGSCSTRSSPARRRSSSRTGGRFVALFVSGNFFEALGPGLRLRARAGVVTTRQRQARARWPC